MNLINETFKKCAGEKRPAFVFYVTAGDPDFKRSLQVIDEVAAGGADILELGVPFSDPLADGEANQLAACRALDSGMTALKVLELAAEVRKKHPNLPLVLFTYMNPVAYSCKFADFCKKAAASGVNAILPLDMPPEESADYKKQIDDAGLGIVSLIAPTTLEERYKALGDYAGAFIYYVSQEGVTGERKEFASGVGAKIKGIKKYSNLPVVVGFGISTPEHVRAAAASGADGIVIGSALVRKVEALAAGKGSLEEIRNFVKSLSGALK